MNLSRRAGLVALALTAGTGAAKAQVTTDTLDVHANRAVGANEASNTTPPCGINDGSPYQLNSARVYLNMVSKASAKEDEKEGHLKDAVRVLDSKVSNENGRNWLLARAYYEWLQRPSVPPSGIVKRGRIGFTSDTDREIDLLAAEDSSLSAVESTGPTCKGETARMRRALFSRFYNQAVPLANTGTNADSAAKLTNRALSIWRENPSAYSVLANAALQKGDTTAALAAFRQAISVAGTDTAYTKLRRSWTYNAALLQMQYANSQPAQRDALLAAAKAQLTAYLQEVPGDANATQALARIAAASGDVQAVKSIYGEMMSNPAKFSDVQLFEAGANAARDKQYADAVKLLEAGLQKNPYHRDALYNLAITYQNMKEGAKEGAVAQRLVAVDPDNAANWTVLSNSYRLKGNAIADIDAKLKLADSSTTALNHGRNAKVLVQLGSMLSQGTKRSISGQVTNKGAAAASYTLKVEFLNASGTVVTSQTATVGPVAPGASASVKVQAEGDGIVGYRYAPLGS